MRQAGTSHQEAREVAVAAVQTVLSLPWKETSVEAVNAVAHTTHYHSNGFGAAPNTPNTSKPWRLAVSRSASPSSPVAVNFVVPK